MDNHNNKTVHYHLFSQVTFKLLQTVLGEVAALPNISQHRTEHSSEQSPSDKHKCFVIIVILCSAFKMYK